MSLPNKQKDVIATLSNLSNMRHSGEVKNSAHFRKEVRSK